MHKQPSGIQESLRNCKDFICKTCLTVAEADDSFPKCITINEDKFETLSEFCYLGDIIGQAEGCIDSVTTHIQSAWKTFQELLSILTNRDTSLLNCGKVFKAYVRSELLYVSATWPMSTRDLSHIKTSDHPMI